MTYGEFLSWVKYANKTGPLRSSKYLATSAAVIAGQFASAYLKKSSGGKFSAKDFLIWDVEEEAATPEQAMEMFKALAAGNQDGK